MDIDFYCSNCRQHLVIEKAGVGLTIQCPTCLTHLTVPPPSPSRFQITTELGASLQCEVHSSQGKDYMEIQSLDFFGPLSRSPSGRFLLAWRDSWAAGRKGRGQYFLVDTETIVASGKMQRPNGGKVSNNGNFILNDWMLLKPEALGGTFYAFTSTGQTLIRKRFRANLHWSNGISPDGRFAFCTTATSDCASVSDKTFVFDLEAKKILSKLDGRAQEERPEFSSSEWILQAQSRTEAVPPKELLAVGLGAGIGNPG